MGLRLGTSASLAFLHHPGEGPGRVGGTPSSGWCAPSLLQMVRARARVPVRLRTNGPHRGSWHRRGAGELALGGEGRPAPATLEGRLPWGRQRQLRPLFRLRRTGKETRFPPAKSQPRQVQFTIVAMSTLSGNDPDRYQKQKKAAAARKRREQAKIEKRSAEMAAAAAEAVAAAGSKRPAETAPDKDPAGGRAKRGPAAGGGGGGRSGSGACDKRRVAAQRGAAGGSDRAEGATGGED